MALCSNGVVARQENTGERQRPRPCNPPPSNVDRPTWRPKEQATQPNSRCLSDRATCRQRATGSLAKRSHALERSFHRRRLGQKRFAPQESFVSIEAGPMLPDSPSCRHRRFERDGDNGADGKTRGKGGFFHPKNWARPFPASPPLVTHNR